MPDLNQELHDWLRKQPNWLQLAAERYLAGPLSNQDIADCVEELKSSGNEKSPRQSRNFSGVIPSSPAQGPLRLTSIGSIVGIENLRPKKPLTFGAGNLCVIYGHNGSGKSGYTRLLKTMCGKPRAKELKPNVFKPAPQQRTCDFTYNVGGADTTITWQADSPPINDLRAVDLFDSDEATAYLTTETTVTYTPRAIALLEALAGVCDRVKACLEEEQNRLVSALPSVPAEYSNTKTGAAWRNMQADTKPEVLRSLSAWTEEDEAALTQLTERLKVQDPAALARVKRNAKGQIEQVTGHLNSLATAFGEPRMQTVRELREEAAVKRRAATEYASVTSAELEGIDTDTWRELWKAAREYSLVAYPGQAFPVTEDARCVLCQQQLDGVAQQRLKDFESFVQSKLEAAASEAERQYAQAIQQLPSAWNSSEVSTRCQAAGLNAPEVVQQLSDFCERAAAARNALLTGETAGLAIALEEPLPMLQGLQERATALEAEAVQHTQDATEFDRPGASAEKLELEARRWTSQQSAAIQPELERLKQVATYEKWKKSANSTHISKKATEFSEQAITEAFVNRFNEELKKLSAAKIRVELIKSKTKKGKVPHKVVLKGSQSPQGTPDSILSEGEQRIIALAAFLADVVDKPFAAPFIFDDPISSLDQDYEWAVATRLAELAKDRQVIVLTHRLSLFGAMEDAAKKLGEKWKESHLNQRFIEAYDGVAGQPAYQDMSLTNTAKANNTLITRLNNVKKEGDDSGADTYRALALGICTDFRKLIERTVEDDLLNQIVRRHRRDVQTQNRLSALTHISAEDCELLDRLMTKYSCFVHSQSSETPVRLPDPSELKEDLESLNTWRGERKKRVAAR